MTARRFALKASSLSQQAALLKGFPSHAQHHMSEF